MYELWLLINLPKLLSGFWMGSKRLNQTVIQKKKLRFKWKCLRFNIKNSVLNYTK